MGLVQQGAIFYEEPALVIGFNQAAYFALDSNALPPAEAEFRFDATGNIQRLLLNFPDGSAGSWASGPVTMSDYDFRADTIFGSPSSPGSQPANVWINGFDGMFWGVRENSLSSVETFSCTMRIRPAGGGADIDTAGMIMDADTT